MTTNALPGLAADPTGLVGYDTDLINIAADRWPDIPGKVHGIVSLDPPVVQCDGCGRRDTGTDLNLVILTSRILFNHRLHGHGDDRRLCPACATAAGWRHD